MSTGQSFDFRAADLKRDVINRVLRPTKARYRGAPGRREYKRVFPIADARKRFENGDRCGAQRDFVRDAVLRAILGDRPASSRRGRFRSIARTRFRRVGAPVSKRSWRSRRKASLASNARQARRISSSLKTRSRLSSAAGALILSHGEALIIPRSTAQLQRRRKTASVRFATIGAPRSTISSRSRECPIS